MKYTNTHKAYFHNGNEIPSATTILKILNKPHLVKWANYLGFKRQNVDDVLNDTSRLGTKMHELIEAIIAGYHIIYIDTDIDKSEIYYRLNSFFEWYNENKIEPIFQEKEFTSEKYGGTLDLYGLINGEYTIVDFKTSKRIRLSMFIQLALYCILLEKYGYRVDKVGIVLVNGKKCSQFITREELNPYIKFALQLVDLYHGYYELNDITGWFEWII